MSSTREEPRSDSAEQPRIRPAVLWFGVLGGAVAWAVHLLVAWSFMEVGCIAPGHGPVLQRGAGPGAPAATVAYAATALPWLVAVSALMVCLVLRRRVRRVEVDPLAGGRVGLMLVVGISLDLMAIAAITGGAVGLIVLEPCG